MQVSDIQTFATLQIVRTSHLYLYSDLYTTVSRFGAAKRDESRIYSQVLYLLKGQFTQNKNYVIIYLAWSCSCMSFL